MNKIQKLYETLFEKYGPQGWWPIIDLQGFNPTKTGSITGYHPKDYSYPQNENQKFEICIGAILTQNTSWIQVEKALLNLKRMGALSVKGFKKLSIGKLKEAIKPAGYYNQKAKKLILFVEFFKNLFGNIPGRNELLDIWGIGPETADSILLYAYNQPEFVIDTYTRRFLAKHNIVDKKESIKLDYDKIKQLFTNDLDDDYKLFQEYHALIVEEGKNELTNKTK